MSRARRPRSARALGAIAAAVLLAPLAACASKSSWTEVSEDCVAEHEFETVEPGRLIVARPEASTRGALNGESLAGVEGDLVRLIAKRNCLEADVVHVGAGDSASAEVERGTADLALGIWHRGEEALSGLRLSEAIVVDANDSGTRDPEERARLGWAASAGNESLSAAIDEEIRALRENGMISELLEKRGLDPNQAELAAPLG